MLFLGSSLIYSPHINHSGQDSPTEIFSSSNPSVRTWGSLEQKQQYQSGDYRLQTGKKIQTRYKMQTENLYCFFVWYVIRDHFTTYQASCNRFSAIIFLHYLHYSGIFLAHFLITVVLNKVSSLRIVFSLCARIGWCDFCTEFTDLIKVDLDVMRCLYEIFNTRNFRETINSFARGPYISSF